MPSVIDLYERLASAPDDKARAKIIAEAFEALEERYPNLSETATHSDLRETELRIIKEIEQIRAELRVEIEKIRADLTEKIATTEARLTEKIAVTKAGLAEKIAVTEAGLTEKITQTHASLLKWNFLFWLSQFAAIIAILWRVWPK